MDYSYYTQYFSPFHYLPDITQYTPDMKQWGKNFIGGITEGLETAMQNPNIGRMFAETVNNFSKSFSENLAFTDMVQEAESATGPGLDRMQDNFINRVDSFSAGISSIALNRFRDLTLTILPLLVVSGALTTGVPLLIRYIHAKATHNIGRPLLAQEVHKIGIQDQIKNGASRAVSTIWDSAKTGIKWSFLAGTAGLTLSTSQGYAGDVLNGLSCAMRQSPYYCDSSPALPLIAATIGIGVLASSAKIVNSFYHFITDLKKKDEQPIFNEELQRRIDDLTTSLCNINQNDGFMQNLLLYGPGGTGKTMISKYIARNSKMNYVMMSGGDLAQYIRRGEHVTELNKLFADINSSESPTILFIDECESLCGDRSKMDKSELTELINSFLSHTGVPSKKVMIILATNRKDDLDPAVLSRMDHKLYIGLPEMTERKKIIELYLSTLMTPLEQKNLFTDTLISSIVEQTEGFTGRLIFKMLNSMARKRGTTEDNILTETMVVNIVNDFVKQEADIVKTPMTPSVKISAEPILRIDMGNSVKHPAETILKKEEISQEGFSNKSLTIKERFRNLIEKIHLWWKTFIFNNFSIN